MQVVVGDDINGVTFSSVQLHSVACSSIHFSLVTLNSIKLHAVPFNSAQYTQLTTYL